MKQIREGLETGELRSILLKAKLQPYQFAIVMSLFSYVRLRKLRPDQGYKANKNGRFQIINVPDPYCLAGQQCN